MNTTRRKMTTLHEELKSTEIESDVTIEERRIEAAKVKAREEELFDAIVIKGAYDMPDMPESSKVRKRPTFPAITQAHYVLPANERKRRIPKKQPAFFEKYNTMQNHEINAVLQGILDKHNTKKDTYDVRHHNKLNAAIERRTHRIINKREQQAALAQREYYRNTVRKIIQENNIGMASAKAITLETTKILRIEAKVKVEMPSIPPSGHLTPATAAMLDNNLKLFDNNMRRMVSKICDDGKKNTDKMKMKKPVNLSKTFTMMEDLEKSMKSSLKL